MSLGGPLQNVYFFVNQKTPKSKTASFNIRPYGKIKEYFFFRNYNIWFNPNCTWLISRFSLTNFNVLCQLRNPKWPPPQGTFNIGSYWKNILRLFISEISKPSDSKLDWNVPWVVFTNLFFMSIRNPRWLPSQKQLEKTLFEDGK